jgi:hypothetical protein
MTRRGRRYRGCRLCSVRRDGVAEARDIADLVVEETAPEMYSTRPIEP